MKTPPTQPEPRPGDLLRLEIEVPTRHADAAAAIPWRLGAQGVALRDGADAPPGRAVICAWLPMGEGAEARGAARTLLGPLAAHAEVRLIAEDPRPWQATLAAPVAVGGFVIAPDLDEAAEAPAGRSLLIEPGSAFGDGAHPTTALCVEGIERLLSGPLAERATPRVLDVGTGTGILGLVAARLGAEVVGTDIDPLARRAAARHARRNRLAERMSVVAEPPDAPFDLVVANLYLDPLIALAPTLAARVAPGGRALVSGIATHHRPRIERVFAAAGLRVMAAAERDGWLALTLAHRATGDRRRGEASVSANGPTDRPVDPSPKREPP